MQAGQGGGLASMGGGGTTQVLGGRGATTLLTRLSWWTGGIFMALSLLLAVVHTRGGNTAGSEVQRQLQLQQQQQQQAPAALPAAPIQGTAPAPQEPAPQP
jgi:preprotein translocase subunit SecG